MLKRREADLAAADVFVPIDARTEILLAVVEMKGLDAIEADRVVELAKRAQILFALGEGIARGEQVAGIDADAQSLVLRHPLNHGRELLEAASQAGALSRRGFQQDLRAGLRRQAMHFVDRPHDV